MKKIEVELLSKNAGNNAVIKMPGRKYTGIAIQGDTLRNIYYHVLDAYRIAQTIDNGELMEELEAIEETLAEIVSEYDYVSGKSGYPR